MFGSRTEKENGEDYMTGFTNFTLHLILLE